MGGWRESAGVGQNASEKRVEAAAGEKGNEEIATVLT